MPEHILIAIAWPYASAKIHAGNVTSSHLPGDICARYHRLNGDHVLMVSGSDSHGTPITVRADEEGKAPREVFERFHHEFLDMFLRLGISYNLFTHTDTENHHRVSQDFFLALLEKGYLYKEVQEQMYSEALDRFLPVEVYAKCPFHAQTSISHPAVDFDPVDALAQQAVVRPTRLLSRSKQRLARRIPIPSR